MLTKLSYAMRAFPRSDPDTEDCLRSHSSVTLGLRMLAPRHAVLYVRMKDPWIQGPCDLETPSSSVSFV